jgi:hypothetical protein
MPHHRLRFVKLFHEFAATALYKDGRAQALAEAAAAKGLPAARA